MLKKILLSILAVIVALAVFILYAYFTTPKSFESFAVGASLTHCLEPVLADVDISEYMKNKKHLAEVTNPNQDKIRMFTIPYSKNRPVLFITGKTCQTVVQNIDYQEFWRAVAFWTKSSMFSLESEKLFSGGNQKIYAWKSPIPGFKGKIVLDIKAYERSVPGQFQGSLMIQRVE